MSARPVTAIIATELPFLDAILIRLGAEKIEKGPLSSRVIGIDGYQLPSLSIIVARGPYGLVPATIHCAGLHGLSLNPSLVVHIGTAGYTGNDIAPGRIVACSSCFQWDADVSGLGFDHGDFPGVSGENAIPRDLHNILPGGIIIRPLHSGSGYVDLNNLPGPLQAMAHNSGPSLVDMEGYGVDAVNHMFSVDGLFLRLVTGNSDGPVRLLNHCIQDAAPFMADQVFEILKQLGRC